MPLRSPTPPGWLLRRFRSEEGSGCLAEGDGLYASCQDFVSLPPTAYPSVFAPDEVPVSVSRTVPGTNSTHDPGSSRSKCDQSNGFQDALGRSERHLACFRQLPRAHFPSRACHNEARLGLRPASKIKNLRNCTTSLSRSLRVTGSQPRRRSRSFKCHAAAHYTSTASSFRPSLTNWQSLSLGEAGWFLVGAWAQCAGS